ncbi:hypothetical protein CspeluHIS016_0800020 [Cutaneotrichosporon spelunceum]|uniref:Zn(2)-C6 fungal-type domain-containing protein n=1 Tax=Cutaneotrichosporon spelunceum TaxID=1672016 RepID=A0AAD3TYV0_9TREE|nr:hypothetical protein CspeluHIS016_0800020 [Cutaneotrichosporon spelunceum]
MGSKPAGDPSPSASHPPAAASRRIKGKRTRTGCLTCRARKVKCDEQPGTCANCERVCLACKWPEVRNVLEERSAAPALASRTVDESPSEADHDPWRGHTNLIHGIPRPIVDRHVEAFFAHVYPVQGNAVVHRGTFMRDVAEGTSSHKVVLAICAVASRFVDAIGTPGGGSQYTMLTGSPEANRWAAEAKADIINSDMSIENITAALILAKHDIYSGRFSQAFVLAALATRMSLALSLHREMPAEADVPRAERETRRRLMYACYSLDRIMSTGVPEFLSVPAHLLHIRLPCAEQKFNLNMESDTPIPNLEDPGVDDFAPAMLDEVGMFGQHVRLLSIRANILRVVRNRRESDLHPWDPSSLFAMAKNKLEAWFNMLPLQFQLEPETVYTRQFQNELTPLTMLHVWYNLNVVELTRISMPGFTESLPAELIARAPPGWVQRTRDLCVSHARLIARTLRHVASLVDMEALIFGDQSLPICVYESARVRLQYAFLLPHEQQPAELEDLTADAAVMTLFIERLGRHFKNSKFLLREMHKMLRRHGLDIGSDVSETSQPGSPAGQDPWSRRVRTLREHAPRRPPPPMPSHSQYYPPLQSSQISANHTSHHSQAGSLPTPAPTDGSSSDHMQQAVPLYGGPGVTGGGFWHSNGHNSGHNSGHGNGHPEEVAALLGELGQAQTMGGVGGMGGGGPVGGGSLMDMFADWVATGYDAGSMCPNSVV